MCFVNLNRMPKEVSTVEREYLIMMRSPDELHIISEYILSVVYNETQTMKSMYIYYNGVRTGK
jgi:hypothetical protein